MLSRDHPGPSCCSTPSLIRWTMAPSRVFSLRLPLFSSHLLLIGCFACRKVGTFGSDCGPVEGEGGRARGGGAGGQRYR